MCGEHRRYRMRVIVFVFARDPADFGGERVKFTVIEMCVHRRRWLELVTMAGTAGPTQVRARWGRDDPLEVSLELGRAARSFSTLILTLDFPDRKTLGDGWGDTWGLSAILLRSGHDN